jgi:hypothetical protein
MKGGITSGVVYPFAVCEIAQTYRFRNVGGTSAGAIAASISAAAEYGRLKRGFQKLAALPQWLGSGSNLLDVFQPQSGTKGIYRLFLAPIGRPEGRGRRLVGAFLRSFGWWFVLGALPGLVALIATLSLLDGFGRGLALGLSAVLLVVGAVAVGIYGLYWTLTHRLATASVSAPAWALTQAWPGRKERKHRRMLCRRSASGWPSTIDELAHGQPQTESPLTFGDLWEGPDRKGNATGEPFLNLQMMTTSLTLGRPYRLPFDSETWFFDPDEFRKRFPERVVKWMEDNGRPLPVQPAKRGRELVLRRLLSPLRPMPDAGHMPVVVATRMSLSFPLLISAVPMHEVDWSLSASSRVPHPPGAVKRRQPPNHAGALWASRTLVPSRASVSSRIRPRPLSHCHEAGVRFAARASHLPPAYRAWHPP